jgi:hypothetical protein
MNLRFSLSQITLFSIYAGTLVGILFIIGQSALDMGSITSRHAQSYIQIGGLSTYTAIALAWFVHIGVSIVYALISVSLYAVSKLLWVSGVQVLLLGWLTTLIATPANVYVMKLVNEKAFPPLNDLPGIHTGLDIKFFLHVLFFVLVLISAYAAEFMVNRNNS